MTPLLFVASLVIAAAPEPLPGRAPRGHSVVPGEIQAEPPVFTPGLFPCSQCHSGPVDRTRRELAFHEEVKLEHDAEHRWCLDCHSAEDRDRLHLSSGEPLSFADSHRLCGQCHGDKHRDWRIGIHGKRTGAWDGQKTYFLCVNCHDPHSPRFKAIRPEPRPLRPEEMRR